MAIPQVSGKLHTHDPKGPSPHSVPKELAKVVSGQRKMNMDSQVQRNAVLFVPNQKQVGFSLSKAMTQSEVKETK